MRPTKGRFARKVVREIRSVRDTRYGLSTSTRSVGSGLRWLAYAAGRPKR